MDIIASMDQLRSLLRDISPVMWGYYSDLQKQGFTQEQAFELTKEFQKTTLNGGK